MYFELKFCILERYYFTQKNMRIFFSLVKKIALEFGRRNVRIRRVSCDSSAVHGFSCRTELTTEQSCQCGE